MIFSVSTITVLVRDVTFGFAIRPSHLRFVSRKRCAISKILASKRLLYKMHP